MKIVDKIGFVIHQIDITNHYLNIWKLLKKNNFVIISYNDHERLLAFCERHKYNYITYENVVNQKIKYKHLVSHQLMGYVDNDERKGYILKQIGLINIRLMYALGKSKWHFAEWNNLYDIILCYGPYQIEKLNYLKRPLKIPVGYPRYDNLFKPNYKSKLDLNKYNYNPNKKTILWLPTYNKLSSIDAFAKEISNLSNEFNVFVKPHPGTIMYEKARVNRLDSLQFTYFFTENIDNGNLFQISDFIICDYGGTAFGTIYLDKNLLLLNVPNAEVDVNIEGDSSDIDLRDDIKNINFDDNFSLLEIFNDEKYWDEQKEARKNLREKYFSPFFGISSQVVANVLNNIDTVLKYRIEGNLVADENEKLQRAEYFIEQGRHNDAEPFLEDILSVNKKSVNALIDLSVVKIFQEKYIDAQNCLYTVQKLEPSNSVAKENIKYMVENGFING